MYLLRILLPVSCLLVFILVFYRRGWCWRSSFLASAVLWGVVLTGITELLSIFTALNGLWLTIAWSAVLAVSIYHARTRALRNLAIALPRQQFLLFALAGIAIIAVVTLLIALVAAPNNADSMAYHMSRVMHWMQNQSVAHYPTAVLPQVELNPWSEFAIAHFQILSQTDRFANLVQWFSMVGSVIGVSLIVAGFSPSLTPQIYAAVFTATIPMGILQSTSTQNDYVVTFWLVCFVYFGLQMKLRPGLAHTLVAGASLGLALLTKGTAYIYAFPFVVYFFITLVGSGKKKAFKHAAVIGLVALALNAGHYYRNYSVFGNILDSGDLKFTNETVGAKTLLSNALRNVALHMGTPFEQFNTRLESGFGKIHALIGADISDPKTTFLDTAFHVPLMNNNEDSAGNPVQFILICTALSLILFSKKARRIEGIATYATALVSAFFLFCLVLKWQPWHSRLHLPLFVLASPVVALFLDGINSRQVRESVIAGLLILAVPWLIFNGTRPLIGFWGHESIFQTSRRAQYFIDKPYLLQSYTVTAERVKENGCGNIGLQSAGGSFEYPFWMLVRESCLRMPRIDYISVVNATAKIPTVKYPLSMVVTMHPEIMTYAELPSSTPVKP